ncbi:hypothetical protein [Kineosporia babensis]|uniref:Uncharacterized protein n=1 Tax=Kineosporia babensis TaxID=499548 RepID=A0A9X1NBP1_9ACTN|nr:hypothetical protein [Kineosporia babensis]MCD5310874.1 hypothetical protein [Kineosporia babensis]
MSEVWSEFTYEGRRRSACFFEQPQGRDLEAWMLWLERHGIDPGNTALGAIAADDELCMVEYFPRGTGAFYGPIEHVQLEAPALPFPKPQEVSA